MALATLLLGKTWCPLYRRLGGPWPFAQVQIILSSTGIQSPYRPACSKSLYWLHSPSTLFRAVIINTIFAAMNMWSVHSTTTTITVMLIMLIITSCLKSFPAMATANNLPLFWNSGFQFFLQHDIYLSVLPYAGGRFVPRAYCWFCDDVSLRRNLYDRILKLCPRLSLRLSGILLL